jgi:hypothetical protein
LDVWVHQADNVAIEISKEISLVHQNLWDKIFNENAYIINIE